jgi:hypothetical protein
MEETLFKLQLRCDDVSESKLQDLTREMTRSLKESRLGSPTLPTEQPNPGEKGDPVQIGAIVLSLIGSHGLAVSLVQVLKVYVDRKPSLKIDLKRNDGQTLTLQTNNLSNKQIEHTAKLVQGFFKK